MGTPFKMKGSPMQRNFSINPSPVKQTKDKYKGYKKRSLVQKAWDTWGPNINPSTKTEKNVMLEGDTWKTTSPGWGKTKTYEVTEPKGKWTQSKKSIERHKKR